MSNDQILVLITSKILATILALGVGYTAIDYFREFCTGKIGRIICGVFCVLVSLLLMTVVVVL
jgi:hypothetical protein